MNSVLVFILMILATSCTNFQARPDISPVPSQNGVLTLEVSACGHSAVGTTSCVIPDNTILKDQSITVHSPKLNKDGNPNNLQIVSRECNVDKSINLIPGEDKVFKLTELLNSNTIPETCVLRLTLSPSWQDSDKLTIPTYPFRGRIILFKAQETELAVVTNSEDPFHVPGYTRLSQRDSLKDRRIPSISIGTLGSSMGEVLIQPDSSCGFAAFKQPYETEIVLVNLPYAAKSCTIVGKVLRADKPSDLDFFISIDSYPLTYIRMSIPSINVKEISFDSLSSATTINDDLIFDTSYKFKDSTGVYTVRQYTITGRSIVTKIKNGKILYNLD